MTTPEGSFVLILFVSFLILLSLLISLFLLFPSILFFSASHLRLR